MTVQEYNDLYKRPMVKNVKIVSSGGVTITNTNIVSEQMSLEKSLCSESNLRFGRCEAACFKVRIADIDHDFTGEWLNVTQDAKADIEGYLLTQDGKYLYTEDGQRIQVEYKRDIEDLAQLGHFKVYSDKPDNDRRWKNLTCYDRMYDILNADVAAWYNGLTFPMTIKALRDSFFNYIGVTQKTTTLVNDNFVTQGGFSVTGSLSGKTVIEAICELNGVFGVMAPDDTFDYVSLANPETLTLDYYVDGTGSYEDYVTDVITGICAKGSESDIGTSVGTTENVYTIVNNPLINGTEGTAALTTALNNLLQNILSISFRPFQVTTYGNPMLPLGTRITINTRNQTIISYVINKEMTGVQGLRDKISAKSDKHQSENINSSYDEIYRTKGKVHELKIDVDGLVSRMATTENKLDNDYYTKSQTESKISQTESEIMTTVSNSYVTQASYNSEIQNLQDQIDGRIEYFDGNVIPTLNNPPANSWTTTAAKDSHIGDLYRYHHGTPEVTDYYRFDKNTNTTPTTYSWVVLGESQVDEALRQAELANQKADAAQTQLDALQSSVEDDYYTKSETNSQISQSASAITQSVSSTYETKSNATSHYDSLDSAAQGYANGALSTANTNAQGYANDAKNAAITDTNTKLQNYYTKSQTDSQISQTATGITQSVSSTYETKSDSTNKFNTANTNAQNYATSAKNAAIADTDSKLQSYYTKSETNSEIEQTAESITNTVSATYTTKQEFNDLEIGGTNILTLSKTIGATWGKQDATVEDGVASITIGSQSEHRIYQVPANAGWSWESNTKYVASIEARSVSGTGVLKIQSNANSQNKSFDITTTWKRYSFDFTTLNSVGTGSLSFYNMGSTTIQVRLPKLEYGDKPTAWSPSPVDTDIEFQKYYTKEETNSQIEQTATSITNTVSRDYTTKMEFNNLAIGGRNLLRATKSFDGWYCPSGVSITKDDFSYASIAGSSSSWIDLRTRVMSTDLLNGTTFVLSFEYASSADASAIFTLAGTAITDLDTVDSPQSRTKYGTFASSMTLPSTSNEWWKVSVVSGALSMDSFVSGSGDVNSWYIQLYNRTNTTIKIRKVKLEYGNKATDWSPSPQDEQDYVDFLQIGGTNILYLTETLATPWGKDNATVTDGVATISGTGTGDKRIYQVPNSTSGWAWAANTKYVVAIDAKASTGTSTLRIVNNGSGGIYKDFTLDTTWTRCVFAFTTNTSVTAGSITFTNSGSNDIQVKLPKLEYGDKSTDWSPAPRDMASKSEIKQLADKIILKVDNNGNIVKVALSADPSTGTEFTVGADNIELSASEAISLMAGGTINLTAGQINITGSSASGSVSIDENGILTCSGANVTGTIHANTGDIGGWSISSDKLYGGADDYFCAMLKPTSTAKYSFVSGATTSAYDDAAFRVTPQGYLYAKNLVLTAYPGNQPSSVLYGKNGIWLYGTTSGSAIWFSDPSTQDLHSTILMMGNTGLIQCKSLNCSGTKKRVVETENYGTRSLYCYETPSPMFGDIGEGKIAEDGKCYVWLDSTFSETIKTESYQVFLQKYGQGECYVTERTSRYFVVEGDAGMCFGWEIKARQAGFENERLETYIEPEKPKDEYDYPMEAIKHLEIIKDERTVA